MTANQIVGLLTPVVGLAIVIFIWGMLRRAKKARQIDSHTPNTPGTGNDPAAMARSAMEGHANSR